MANWRLLNMREPCFDFDKSNGTKAFKLEVHSLAISILQDTLPTQTRFSASLSPGIGKKRDPGNKVDLMDESKWSIWIVVWVFSITLTGLLTECLTELFNVFLCRHILAAVHFNFNLHRDVRHCYSENAEQLKFKFSMFKKATVQVLESLRILVSLPWKLIVP